MDRVVVIVKPDGVKRGLTGEILARFERAGLKTVALKMVSASRELVEKHYPFDRLDFLKGMGEKTKKTAADYDIDVKKVFGTEDALGIGKKINTWNVEFLTSGPVVAVLLEGMHAVDNARKIGGATFPLLAVPGTIRGDFAIDSSAYSNAESRAVYNLLHISGSDEEAKHEESIWFTKEDRHNYKRLEENLYTS